MVKRVDLKEDRPIPNLLELDLLARHHHPHVIALHELKVADDHMEITIPLVNYVLEDLQPHLSLSARLKLIGQVVDALCHLHSLGIGHYNIRPQHIGVAIDGPMIATTKVTSSSDKIATTDHMASYRALITDLGSCRYLNKGPSFKSPYHPPDERNIDLWMVGLLILEFVVGLPLNLDKCSQSEVIISNFVRNYASILKDRVDNAQVYDLLLGIFGQSLNLENLRDHPLLGVKNKGRECEPEVRCVYTPDHRETLKVLIRYLQQIYSNESVELLFLGLDIYNRASVIATSNSDRLVLGLTSIWIAYRLITSSDVPMDAVLVEMRSKQPSLEVQDIIKMERRIIHHLQGNIGRSPIYRRCQSSHQLSAAFTELIMNRNSQVYIETDYEKWFQEHKATTTSSKEITICKFIQ